MMKHYNDETMALLKRAMKEQIPYSDCNLESFQSLSNDKLVKSVMIKGVGCFTISDEGKTYLKTYEVEETHKEETLELAREANRIAKQANRRAWVSNAIAIPSGIAALCSIALWLWKLLN